MRVMRLMRLMVAGMLLGAGTGWGATIGPLADVERATVAAAIEGATAGDTILLPEDSATWSTSLNITKSLTLRGAGVGKTIIYGNVGLSTILWGYEPEDAAADLPFRVTQITWNGLSNSCCFAINNTNWAYPLHNIRIDHNEFLHFKNGEGTYVAYNIFGAVCGVFDHNMVSNNAVNCGWFIHNNGNNSNDWNRAVSLGTTNTMVYEDNVFFAATMATGAGFGIAGVAWGGGICVRYNNYGTAGNSITPLFDAHGNQTDRSHYASRQVEIYGNRISTPNIGSNQLKLFHHRGGVAVCFNNLAQDAIGSPWIHVQEEYDDGICPSTNLYPQHVSSSYYWNNREDGTNGDSFEVSLENESYESTNVITANVDWFSDWTDPATPGIKAGTLGNRPDPWLTNCGYWATTQSTNTIPLSCVGTNPSTPISGTLYKALTLEVWTNWYTPLIYPHPLVTAQDGGVTVAARAASPMLLRMLMQ